ncbi:MO25-like protein, partial [Capsicum chinense]
MKDAHDDKGKDSSAQEEESYNAYNSYAVARDFVVRKGGKTNNVKGETISCLFLCSCEGQSDKLSPFQERKQQRLEYRCGYMARIKFKISNGIWEVCEFNDVHSHPMIEDNLKHFMHSDRRLTNATKNILGSMIDADIHTKKVVQYLQNETVGVENVGFIELDAHNFVQAHKRNMISSGDAQTLINHFMHLQSEDSNFFYSFQVDEDGRVGLKLCDYSNFRATFVGIAYGYLQILNRDLKVSSESDTFYATQVVTNLQRQQVQSRLIACNYLEANIDLMDILVAGYENTDMDLHYSTMLRECIRHQSVARYVLEPVHVKKFFDYIQLPNFDIVADAAATFKELLTRHKSTVAEFLSKNYDW